MPLTEKQIRNIKPEEKIRQYPDGGGLYLKVNPNSGKYWRYDYRFGGKRRTLALGVYPQVSLKQAREVHWLEKSLLAQGTDPEAEIIEYILDGGWLCPSLSPLSLFYTELIYSEGFPKFF